MADIIKNVGYGIVSKSVRMSVFLTPNRYMELVTEARAYKINAKSDSELINRVIDVFIEDMPVIRVERDRMKEAIAQKNSVIGMLELTISDLKDKQKVKK